jgi:hypothetical protein
MVSEEIILDEVGSFVQFYLVWYTLAVSFRSVRDMLHQHPDIIQ